MKKILLIEDHDEIRENTAEILELASYAVVTAVNGKDGVEKALAEKPDLIICDIMMPVLDGYGVLHLLQKNPDAPQIPFIFLSAKAERSDLRRGMEQGADDYITKPFTGIELLNAVERRLRKYESLKEELAPGLEGLNQILRLKNHNHHDGVDALIQDRNINKYKKKQIIYSEGNRPSRLYYIIKGKVKVVKTNDDAKDLVVGLYNEGDFLGYTALFEGSIYRDTAEAMEDTDLAIIPKEEFEDLINKDIVLLRKFARLLAKNVLDHENQLISMAYNSLRKKVAEALISVTKTFQKPDNLPFVIDLSRENLASIAGTATESLIRTLSDFKSEKLIEIQGSKITIVNLAKLEKLLN